MISTPRWTELKSRVRDYLGTKVEFRLGDINDTQIDRMTREIPANRPGRAISSEKHHLMIGVPRIDGVHSAEIWSRRSPQRCSTSRRAHRASAGGQGAARAHPPTPAGPEPARPGLRLPHPLDDSARLARIGPVGGPQPTCTRPRTCWSSVRRSRARPRIAHAVAQAICARNSPDQVRFMLADYRSGLLDAVPDSHLLDCGSDQPQQRRRWRSHQSAGGQPRKSGCRRPT